MTIFCFDIDGVLCNNEPEADYEHRIPNMTAIARVNKLYDEGHTIKIFTGRGSKSGIDWREFTEKQLKEWGVKYHELIMGKPHADVFIDDRAVNVKHWLSPSLEGWLTVKDIAKELGICPTTVRRLIIDKKIYPKVKIGATWVFEESEVERFRQVYSPISGRIKVK